MVTNKGSQKRMNTAVRHHHPCINHHNSQYHHHHHQSSIINQHNHYRTPMTQRDETQPNDNNRVNDNNDNKTSRSKIILTERTAPHPTEPKATVRVQQSRGNRRPQHQRRQCQKKPSSSLLSSIPNIATADDKAMLQ